MADSRELLQRLVDLGGTGGGGGSGGDASAAKQDITNAALGAPSGAAVVTDANGTIQQYLRGITKRWADALGAGTAAAALRVALATDAPLPAGTAELGKTNWRHINVAGASLTRAANATPYSIGDSISDNATPASVTALSSNNLSDINDDPINLMEILLDTTDTGPGTAGALIRMHLFNTDPTASSGVVGGDNLAYSNKRAGWFGSFVGVMRPFSDGSKGVLLPGRDAGADEGGCRIAFVASGAKNIWWRIATLTAFTPSANSTVWTPRFKGFQGRV